MQYPYLKYIKGLLAVRVCMMPRAVSCGSVSMRIVHVGVVHRASVRKCVLQVGGNQKNNT